MRKSRDSIVIGGKYSTVRTCRFWHSDNPNDTTSTDFPESTVVRVVSNSAHGNGFIVEVIETGRRFYVTFYEALGKEISPLREEVWS